MDSKYRIGIDPGWKNLGLAIVKEEDGKLTKIHTQVMNPSSYSSFTKFIRELHNILNAKMIGGLELGSVTIERFVAYAGVSTAETENICGLIGALDFYFGSWTSWWVESLLIRAIDWKIPLVQALNTKKGFENPSSKLDKKFSIAAAKACLDEPVEFATDHEADAVCLACFPKIVKG